MGQMQRTLILTFATATQALAAEDCFGRHDLPGRLIPTPQRISAGCGLAWKALPQDKAALVAALEGEALGWLTAWELDL